MRFSGISLVVRRRARFDNLPNMRAQRVGASSLSSLVHCCAPEAAPVNLASGRHRSDDQLVSAERKRSNIRHGNCISRGKSHLLWIFPLIVLHPCLNDLHNETLLLLCSRDRRSRLLCCCSRGRLVRRSLGEGG